MGLIEEELTEFKHIVGVTALWSLEIVDILRPPACCKEMLTHTVASDADGAVVCHISPEVVCRSAVFCGSRRFSVPEILLIDAFETNEFRHLGVGMLPVEKRLVERLHSVDLILMAVLHSRIEVFDFSKKAVGICQRLVHSSMLPSEHALHVGLR